MKLLIQLCSTEILPLMHDLFVTAKFVVKDSATSCQIGDELCGRYSCFLEIFRNI